MRKITYKKISEELKSMVEPSMGLNRSSMGIDNQVGEYFFIDINDLIPFKKQARKRFSEDEILSLSESIKMHGVRQPLTIIPSMEIQGKYEVVSGERRLRASKMAGLLKVPCMLINDYKQAEEIALIENLHREDLHPIELGTAFEQLIKHGVFNSQAEIAQKLSISIPNVSEHIKYTRLDEDVKNYLIQNNVTNKEKLRKLSKFVGDSYSQKKFLGMIPSEDKILEHENFSVLRVLFEDGELKVRKSGIQKLSENTKKELKTYLTKILEEI